MSCDDEAESVRGVRDADCPLCAALRADCIFLSESADSFLGCDATLLPGGSGGSVRQPCYAAFLTPSLKRPHCACCPRAEVRRPIAMRSSAPADDSVCSENASILQAYVSCVLAGRRPGFIDLEQKIAQPLDARFGPRLQPISQVRCVADVSGSDKGKDGSGGGTRTPDPRIMIPVL